MKIIGYRKLLALVGSVLTVVLVQVWGMDQEVANKITEAVVTLGAIFLGSQATVDVLAPLASSKAKVAASQAEAAVAVAESKLAVEAPR